MKSLSRIAGAMASLWVSGSVLASEGGGGSALIQPTFGTFLWTLVTFLLLLFLLGKFAWKPLIAALEGREKTIHESIEQAREDREQAQQLLAEQRELLDQTRREQAGAVAAGQRDAEALKAEILDGARAQREQLLKQTEEQVQAEMNRVQGELRGIAVDLAIEGAGKLLSENLDDATQRRLVEEYLQELETGATPSA